MTNPHIEIENKSARKSGWHFLPKNDPDGNQARQNTRGLFFIIELFVSLIKAMAG